MESCEARVGMFYTRKDQESSFHHCGGSVKLLQACLSARNHRESSFNHCGVSVKLLEDCLSS